jgi:hypothetical protein|tara:strand:+ start:524 stop:655 length:132 start_codon:yes stop_codon:yes gene_type:complete
MNNYLCLENGDYFTVEAESLEQAREYAIGWGAVAICDVELKQD